MAREFSELTKALLETAQGFHQAGAMRDDTYRKITVRHLGPDALPTAAPISAEEIREVRERAI